MQNQDYGAAPSLRLQLSPKTELTLTSLIEHNHDMSDYGLPPLNGHPAPVSRANFYGLTDNATVQDVQVLGARIKYELAPTLTLRNQAQYSHYRIDASETAANSVGTCSADPCTAADFTVLPTRSSGNYTNLPLDQLYVQLGSHGRNITDSSVYDQADAEWRFETGPISHKLIVGNEIGRDTYTNQGYRLNNLPIVSLANPIYESGAQAGVTTTAGNLSRATATTYAAYFNDTLSLGKHWKVVGGLRWDRFHAELSNTVPSSRSIASAEQTVYFNSVRSGILYQPTNEQTYYVSYGTSFDPSLEQLTGTLGTQTLPPEKNRSYEIGAKWNLFGDDLSLTSSLFQVKQTNSRSQVDTGVYEMNGTVRVNGAEVTFAGRITPKWQVFGGYTYLDGKIVDPSPITGDNGNQPANMPRNNATLWTSYALTQSWSAGTGLIWQSSRFANTTNVVSVPSFVRWDATVAYVRPHYDVRLNLLNLSNVHYFDNVIQSDGGRAVPGIDRSAQVTLTYRF